MKYWLVKSEPGSFSFDDLKNITNKTTYWDGVRNYQARNFLRDEMKKGDKVLFYHSNTEPNIIPGWCTVVKEGYPDFTAFDPELKHFDVKSTPDKPVWYMVDLRLEGEFRHPVTLQEIKDNPELKGMRLLQRGSRLSVMPVEKEEFEEITRMGSK